MNLNEILAIASKYFWEYGPKILIALVIYLVGSYIIKKVSRLFRQVLSRNSIDPSLSKFFASVVDIGLKVILLLVVAGRLGFETTSFIALFSALTLAIGFALQGSLGNFASGVLILLFKPYKIGDLITVDEKSGVVDEIQIFNTILSTAQGKKIIIPNGKVTEGPIENISSTEVVRVDVVIDVKDNTQLSKLKPIIEEVIQKYPAKIKDKPIHLKIIGFPRDAMSVEIGCWVEGSAYWDTFYYLNEAIKEAFDAHSIEFAKEDKTED